MSSRTLRIAIVGAGPAGLTLGVLLHKRNIPFTIFELRSKPTEEELSKPSGSLDLHEESGLAALKECGLYEEFCSLCNGECSEAQKVADKAGNIIYQDEGELSNRPEISRHSLTKLFLDHLPEDGIMWNHKLVKCARSPPEANGGHDKIELDFGSNGKHTFDLAIGADGAWSKIRALLTDVRPQYTGVQNVTINIRQLTSRYRELADFVGTGSFSCLGDHHGVMSQRSVNDAARIYLFISTSDERYADTSGLVNKTPAEAKDQLLVGDQALFSTWGGKVKELIASACDDESNDNPSAKLDIKPLYSLPVGHSWTHQPGATLLGDAAHLFPPWAGEGVNQAMLDALELSRVITKAADDKNTLDRLTAQFELGMLARAKEEAVGTAENGEMMFGSEDGAAAMKAFFEQAYGPNAPRPE